MSHVNSTDCYGDFVSMGYTSCFIRFIKLKGERAMNNFQDVVTMYKKFGIVMSTEPRLLDNAEMDFRLNCLHEELMELANATLAKDLPEVIDALIDLTVFAMGTAAVMGVNWQEHWVEVMRANNDKEVGRGKREYSVDLIKPVGWQEPNHKKILGWEQIELPLTKEEV